MGKTQPSKKELNEQKKKEEEHAAAQVIPYLMIIFRCIHFLLKKVLILISFHFVGL